MKHPGIDVLVGLMDGSLSASARQRTSLHVSSCATCAGTIDWMRATRDIASDATRLSAPPAAWSAIEARLDRGDTVLLPVAAEPRRRPARAAAIAAGLILCASFAAALVPQTGLRTWIEQRFRTPEPATPVDTTMAAPAFTGMFVAPVNGVVHVELESPAAPLRLRVRRGDGARLEVMATGPAVDAQFVAGSGRIEIVNASGGEIQLVLPGSARVVTIAIDGATVLETRGTSMTVNAPHADTTGAEIILPIR